MLFLHGFTGSPASGDRLKGSCPRARPWIAPALLGHGGLLDARSFEEECARLLKLVPPGSRCVAYSLGARLALTMACLEPEHFGELVLIGANPGLESKQEREARRADDERRADGIEAGGVAAFVDRWEKMPLFGEDSLPDRIRSERRAIRLSHSPEGLAAALRRLGLGTMEPLWDRLPTLPMRVTFVAGEHDAKFRALAARAAELVPQGRSLVVAGAAHDVLLSHHAPISRLLEPSLIGARP